MRCPHASLKIWLDVPSWNVRCPPFNSRTSYQFSCQSSSTCISECGTPSSACFFTFSDGWIGDLLIVLNECYNYLISFSFLLIILSYLFCLLSIWFWIDQVESILSFSRFYSINLLYLPLVRVFFWHSHTNLIYKLHIISSCLHRRESDMNNSKDI